MPEPTSAQDTVFDELIDRYGEGEKLWDGEDMVFVIGPDHATEPGKSFLIAPDGALNELDESSVDGVKGSDSFPESEVDPESSALGVAEDQRADAAAHTGSGGEPTAAASPASSVSFPLDSFREAALHLRRPFTPEAVKWKTQATWAKGALIAPYVDARLVIERLNLVVPHLWFDDYEPLAGGKGLLCRLTVDGITRHDVGSGYEGKGLFSDALKRAAVKFGVGVSLYALPKIIFDNESGFLKRYMKKTPRGEKEVVELADKGIERCHSGYRFWLAKTGIPMFGDPLDHGDVFGAVGDIESEAAPTAPAAEEETPVRPDDATAKALIARAEEIFKPSKAMTKTAFRRQLESAASHAELQKLVETLEGTEARA